MFVHYHSLFLTVEEKQITMHHEGGLAKAPASIPGAATLSSHSQVPSLTFLEERVEEQQSPPS